MGQINNQQKAIDAMIARNNRKKIADYGVGVLDDFLHGVYNGDLTIITAATGAGKTELSYDIAFRAAKTCNVILYALESDVHEPVQRRLFRIISDLYYSDNDPFKKKLDMSYRNFIDKIIDTSKYEQKAVEIFGSQPMPDIVYYDGDFTPDKFKQHLLASQTGYQLVVLDHLDYFDMDMGLSENQQMANLMRELRRVNMELDIAVIAVSHLRKTGRKTLMPAIDDLMGSSNKAKMAKTVITIAPDKDGYIKNGLFPTLFSIQKSRTGTTGNLLAKHVFNAKTNSYDEKYTLNKYNQYEDTIVSLDAVDYPSWAIKTNITDTLPF
jgi:replicative DNA helicase